MLRGTICAFGKEAQRVYKFCLGEKEVLVFHFVIINHNNLTPFSSLIATPMPEPEHTDAVTI